MNKLKFIPVLAVVALLSACGTKSEAVKAPKFDKEGAEVQYTEFMTDLTENAQALDIMGDKKAASFEMKSEAVELQSNVLKRDGKNFNSESRFEQETNSGQYDSKSLVGKEKVNRTVTEEYETTDYHYRRVNNTKFNGSVQEVVHGDVHYLGSVDIDCHVVGLMDEVTDEKPFDTLIDQYVKGDVYYYGGLNRAEGVFVSLSSLSEEALVNYTFNKNDKTFTFTYKLEQLAQEEKNDQDEVVFVSDYVVYTKTQMTFNGGNYKISQYYETKNVMTYKMDVMQNNTQYYADDVIEDISKGSYSASFTSKEVNLKPASTEGFMFMVW